MEAATHGRTSPQSGPSQVADRPRGHAPGCRPGCFASWRRRWAAESKVWLAPIVITLVLFGILLVLAKGSAIAPFIYTLF